MATQRPKGSRIELRAYAGTDPATGRRHYLSETVSGDTGKRELDRRIRALDARAADLAATRRRRRHDPTAAPAPKQAPAGRTIADAVEAWWRGHGSKQASAPKVRSLIDSIILPELGPVKITLLAGTVPDDGPDPDITYLSETWEAIATRRALKPATIHRCHGIVGAALRRAGRPIADPGLPPIPPRPSTIPLPSEMAGFLPYLSAPTETRSYTATRRVRGSDRTVTYTVAGQQLEPTAMDLAVEAAALLVASGPRPTEVAALTRAQIDPATGRCSLDGRGVVLAAAAGESWVVAEGQSVKRRARVITLDPHTVGSLRRWLAFQDRHALMAGHRLGPRALVFSLAGDARTPLSPKVVSKAFTRAVTRARADGVELPDGFCLYSMRHYGISAALRAGRDVTSVAQRFGTSARMIHARYAHAIPTDDARIADTLGELWGQALG